MKLNKNNLFLKTFNCIAIAAFCLKELAPHIFDAKFDFFRQFDFHSN